LELTVAEMDKFADAQQVSQENISEKTISSTKPHSILPKLNPRQRMMLAIFLLVDTLLVCAAVLLAGGKISIRF
jgi:hypothetical protein